MERRVNDFRGLNLGRSIDESLHRLQHFWISIRVVRFRIGFVVPQTDGGHIDSARTGQRNFILKAILLAKYRKNIFSNVRV